MSSQNDIPARITGIIVFLAGIALLGFVFSLANTLFHMPAPTVPTTSVPAVGTGPSPAVLEIGRSFSVLGQKILLLLLMCIAGSVISSKGIQLYFAARPQFVPATPAPTVVTAPPASVPAAPVITEPVSRPIPAPEPPAPLASTPTPKEETVPSVAPAKPKKNVS